MHKTVRTACHNFFIESYLTPHSDIYGGLLIILSQIAAKLQMAFIIKKNILGLCYDCSSLFFNMLEYIYSFKPNLLLILILEIRLAGLTIAKLKWSVATANEWIVIYNKE